MAKKVCLSELTNMYDFACFPSSYLQCKGLITLQHNTSTMLFFVSKFLKWSSTGEGGYFLLGTWSLSLRFLCLCENSISQTPFRSYLNLDTRMNWLDLGGKATVTAYCPIFMNSISHISHAFREFLQIWHKHPLGLETHSWPSLSKSYYIFCKIQIG